VWGNPHTELGAPPDRQTQEKCHDPSPYWKSLPSFDRDFGTDTCSDVMGRSGDIVKIYAGNCQTGFPASYQIASGLSNFNKFLQAGDFNGGLCIDMLAANSSGVMYLYPGNWSGSPGNCTATFGTRIQIGSGWNSYLDVFGPGDFDGDGCNDVMGRNVAWTTLYLWRGNCARNGVYWKNGGLPIAIGSGWTIRDKVWPVGDFDTDGCRDDGRATTRRPRSSSSTAEGVAMALTGVTAGMVFRWGAGSPGATN